MNEKLFREVYHDEVKEKLSLKISELMQNWHRELAPKLAAKFKIDEEEAFGLMERDYFRHGEVALEFYYYPGEEDD